MMKDDSRQGEELLRLFVIIVAIAFGASFFFQIPILSEVAYAIRDLGDAWALGTFGVVILVVAIAATH